MPDKRETLLLIKQYAEMYVRCRYIILCSKRPRRGLTVCVCIDQQKLVILIIDFRRYFIKAFLLLFYFLLLPLFEAAVCSLTFPWKLQLKKKIESDRRNFFKKLRFIQTNKNYKTLAARKIFFSCAAKKSVSSLKVIPTLTRLIQFARSNISPLARELSIRVARRRRVNLANTKICKRHTCLHVARKFSGS